MDVRLAVLLAGVNVGGKTVVSMAELRELLSEAGYGEVRTLLASGNVVLESAGSPDAVASDVRARLAAHAGREFGVVARTAEEIAAVVEADPLGEVRSSGSKSFVGFCSAVPDTGELLDDDHGGESVVLLGRELYFDLPGGAGRSKLMIAADKQVKVDVMTVRNWNTVCKIDAALRA